MGYKQVLWYFFPYERPIAKFPRMLALDVFNDASRDELALIEAGLARTPQEAKRLLDKYQDYDHVLDLIEALTRKQSGVFWKQLKLLFMRIQGATDRNPLWTDKETQFYSVHYKDYSNDK